MIIKAKRIKNQYEITAYVHRDNVPRGSKIVAQLDDMVMVTYMVNEL